MVTKATTKYIPVLFPKQLTTCQRSQKTSELQSTAAAGTATEENQEVTFSSSRTRTGAFCCKLTQEKALIC